MLINNEREFSELVKKSKKHFGGTSKTKKKKQGIDKNPKKLRKKRKL